MEIVGAESLTREQLLIQLQNGGKLIRYVYCISLIAVTIRRFSPVYYVSMETNPAVRSWPYLLITLFLGWWGVPWGLVYTPQVILMNLGGGEDVTEEVGSQL